jgi:hypothetical protein
MTSSVTEERPMNKVRRSLIAGQLVLTGVGAYVLAE